MHDPAGRPVVGTGVEPDLDGDEQRAEPGRPEEGYAKLVAPGHGPELMDYAAETSSASLPSCFCHHSDSRRWISVCAFAT
jgi:hypothetical protein